MIYPSEPGAVMFLRANWFMHMRGASAHPKILKHLEVGNTSADAPTFRLTLMTADNGTPGTSNAFLVWDTSVAPGEVWTWEGQVPLSGWYFCWKAAGAGLTLYIGSQEGVS